jgi:hypothetical protein
VSRREGRGPIGRADEIWGAVHVVRAHAS